MSRGILRVSGVFSPGSLTGATQAHRKTDRVLRQLEAGGAVARAALRKLLLSRMTLEERVAKVREAR